MSLIAATASPMRKTRRPGRPRAGDTSTRQMHLRALDYLANYKMTHVEVARLMDVSRQTVHRWAKRAARYPEARQILAGPDA